MTLRLFVFILLFLADQSAPLCKVRKNVLECDVKWKLKKISHISVRQINIELAVNKVQLMPNSVWLMKNLACMVGGQPNKIGGNLCYIDGKPGRVYGKSLRLVNWLRLPYGKNCPFFKKTESHKRIPQMEIIWESTESVECNVNGHRHPFEGQKFPFVGSIWRRKVKIISRSSDSSPTGIRLWEIIFRL